MILFVCVHNAGRSVMAEAFARAAGLDAISAGTEPSGHVHPEVVEAMSELGFDVAGHEGVLLTSAMVERAARVITMGCAVDSAVCPAILYANKEDWGLDDPKGKPQEDVRKIRDEVRARVETLAVEVKA
ncbi:MAG: arsenate reductase ArsC [Actinomycetota bacterium]